MFYFYISIGLFILFIFLLILISSIVLHHQVFKNRYEPDGIIQYYTPKDFPQLEVSLVEIPTKAGVLRGGMYSYPMEHKGILVFSHGMWGSHSAYVQEIEYFAKAGFLVLGFDYYGTERSEGKNIKGLGNSLWSLDQAVSYIKKNYPTENIYVVGHSWGGFAALGIAKYHPDLKGIVAMSPFISLTSILKHLLPKMLWILIPFLILNDFFKCGSYSFVKAKHVLKNTRIPTLILHSKDDKMVPYATATKYLQSHLVNSYVEFWILDNKGHNPDYSLEALAYTKEVMAKQSTIAKEDLVEYRKSLDYHRMGILDLEVMKKIEDFLKK